MYICTYVHCVYAVFVRLCSHRMVTAHTLSLCAHIDIESIAHNTSIITQTPFRYPIYHIEHMNSQSIQSVVKDWCMHNQDAAMVKMFGGPRMALVDD